MDPPEIGTCLCTLLSQRSTRTRATSASTCSVTTLRRPSRTSSTSRRASRNGPTRDRNMSLHTAVATIHTNKGDIRVNLFGNHAPKTVKNFVDLATGKQEWTHPRSEHVSAHCCRNDPHEQGRHPRQPVR